MVKFGERFHGKEGVEVGNRDGVSGGKKRFFGVHKQRNRWRARIRNPLLRTRVHLGLFGTPEEAALAVEKKKAEFEEMIKGQESLRMGTCRSHFEGKKLPGGWGVRRQIGRNHVHIRHLKLKNWVSGGSYRACEDVAIVADKKKEEFLETNGGNVGKLRVISGDVNVPSGVKRTQSGKWVARIKMPGSKDRTWFGIYNTLEEAIGSFNKKKAEFDAKQKKPEFDCAESGSGSEASESAVKEGGEVETRDGDSGVKKRFLGVDKQGNRWRAQTTNLLLRATVYLGYYRTPEEAARVVKKKRAEFEEMLKGMDRPSTGTCRGCFEGKKLRGGGRKKKRAEFEETFEGSDSSSMGTCKGYFERKKFYGKEGTRDGVSGVKKRFLGVDKQKNRWRARVRNPLLGTRVYLGQFGTSEEAALAVEKKKAEFEEMIKGQKSSSMETCRSHFEGKKLPGGWGVRRQIGRNRVHIRHLKLKNWVSGGSYRACEDVAIVVDKKKEEFLESGNEWRKFRETEVMCGGDNVPSGVKRTQSGKWVARIKMPESKDRNWFGIYNTLEEAIGSFNKKKAEFDAKHKKPEFECAESGSGSEASESAHKEGGEVETRDGDSVVKKRFLGVDKQGNRWRARTTNPLLRATVYLGYYRTPEEAARVVKKKRAEYEEMLKGMDSSSTGTCRGCFEGKKLRGGGRKKKRAEFEETFEGSDSSSMGTCKGYFERKKFYGKEGTRDGVSGVKRRFLGVDKVGNRGRIRVTSSPQGFEEMFKGQESSIMGTCRDYFEGKKLPGGWGVRRNREHIRHPKSMNWVSGGSYRACVDVAIVADRKKEKLQEMYRGKVGKLILMSGDAISAFNKKNAEFDAKQNSQKWPEFDSAEFRSGSEASESPMKFENELGYDRPTLLLSAHNLNNVALDDNSINDCGVVDIPGKLGDGLVYSSPTSVSDPKNTSTASVGDKTFDSEFDRALGLGIIDEYGQLLDKYSEFDTHMWLRPT